MPDNPETQIETPVPNAPDPGDNTSASPVASQAVDPSVSFNQQLQAEFGLTSEEVRNLKKGMNEAQQVAAEARKRLRPIEPLLDYAARDQNLMPYLFEKAREYDNGVGGQVDPGVLRVLDPIHQDVRRANQRLDEWEYHQAMNELASSYPDFVTADVKRALSIEAEATGNYDVQYQFYKLYGKTLMERAKQSATKDAVKQIQANNQLYTTGQTTSAVIPKMPVAQMSEEEKQKFVNSEIDRIMNDADYAAKLARELG